MIVIILVLQMKTESGDVKMTYPSYSIATSSLMVGLKSQHAILVRHYTNSLKC